MADTRKSMNLGNDVTVFATNLNRAANSVIPTMTQLRNIVQTIVNNLNSAGARVYGNIDPAMKVSQGAPTTASGSGGAPGTPTNNRIAVGPAAAFGAAQLASAALPGTNQLIQQDLLTSRSAAMGFGGGNYLAVNNMQNQLNRMGTITDQLDATRALTYAKAAGLAGPNFMGGANSVMGGVAQMSNITPGLGLTGSLQAYGALQQGSNVNALLGIGIQIRNMDGSMKSFNEIVDEVWNKLNREKVGSAPISSSDLDIMLQPGNGLARLLDFYFGSDPGLRASIQTAMYVKAENNGKALGAISKTTLQKQGFTTNAILSLSNRTAAASRVSQQIAPAAAGGFALSNDVAAAGSNLVNAITPVTDAFTALSTSMQGIGGIGNGMVGKAVGMAGGAGLGAAIGSMVPGIGTVLGALLGGLIGGRATGGPVNDKVPYIVGEKGPELFVPETNGTIIPNHVIGRAGGGDVTAEGFAKQLLAGLGVKATAQNVSDVTMWEGMEGGNWHNTASFNPLNTSYQMSGSTNYSTGKAGSGVQAYKNWGQGLQATIATLTGQNAGARGYTNIINMLKTGTASQSDFLSALQASSWDAGHYSGGMSTSSGGGAAGGSSTTDWLNQAGAFATKGAVAGKSSGSTTNNNIVINLTGSADSTANANAIKKALSDPNLTIGKS